MSTEPTPGLGETELVEVTPKFQEPPVDRPDDVVESVTHRPQSTSSSPPPTNNPTVDPVDDQSNNDARDKDTHITYPGTAIPYPSNSASYDEQIHKANNQMNDVPRASIDQSANQSMTKADGSYNPDVKSIDENPNDQKIVASQLVRDPHLLSALDPANKSISSINLEMDFNDEDLTQLIDLADVNQCLGLLAKLEGDKRKHETLAFHNLSFVQHGISYINNVSGYLEPGQLVGLIGSPDSGISLLLDILAGRVPLTGQKTGEILYGGQPINSSTRQHIGYVVKTDPNLPEMTVYETLNFSARLRVAGESQKLLRFRTLLWMKVLGLSHTYSTIVGDALHRGVSGGERRRVSYGCEMIAGHSIVLADLPTNGLDSTSAYALIKNVTTIAKTGRSMLVSLVQPSPEILDLLGRMIVMSKGSIIYTGPPSQVEQYFNGLGFFRPEQNSLPDWVEMMSGTPERFWNTNNQSLKSLPAAGVDEDVEKFDAAAIADLDQVKKPSAFQKMKHQLGMEASAPYCPPQGTKRGQAWLHLTQSYHQSKSAVQIQEHLTALPRVQPDSMFHQFWNQYSTNVGYQFVECCKRQALLTYRNKGLWLGNMMQSIVLGLILGSLFYQIPLSQEAVRVRFGLLFFLLMHSGNGTSQMIPVHFTQRETFYNQRQNGYFSSAAYYLSTYLVQLPIGLVETFILALIVYPMAELHDSLSTRFLFFWLILVMVNWISRAFIQLVVSVSPTEAVTQVLHPITMLLFTTLCGFLAPKSSQPAGWSWIYYLSYYSYAIKAIAINEHVGLVFECPAGEQCAYTTGEQVLSIYDMQGDLDDRWENMLNLVWFFIAFNVACAFMYVVWQWHHAEVGEPPNFFDTEKISKERSTKMIERQASKARSQLVISHKSYIEWRDLCYSVPINNKETKTIEQRQLLNNTFGYAKPNVMVALMGASGAGKSTLLDVLALKKNFDGQIISGKVLVNGVEQDPVTFSRVAGYVEQFDSHNPFSTVREAIEFSARLRLPSVTSEHEIQASVDRVMSALGLTHLANQLIGDFETGGISPEARKKVTIAVELIINPSILFLDEPTTGLDAPGAFSVMTAVRELARQIAVVCTIHQPSAEIVNMFDSLLLMKSGGQVAYFGPLKQLPQYFHEQNLGEYTEGQNMGDFALSCIKRAEVSKKDLLGNEVDVATAYLRSSQGQHVMAELERGVVPDDERNGAHVLPESSYPGVMRQLTVLTKRFFVSGYRDSNTNNARCITACFFAFMCGTLFIQMGHTQLDASNRVSCIFMSIMFALFSAPVKAPARFNARPVFFRERGSRMYAAGAYWAGRFLGDVPTIVGEMSVFSLVVYFGAGLTLASGGTHFANFWIGLITIRVLGLQFNETITGLAADAAAGTGLFALSLIICMLFSGFLIPANLIPDWWYYWMYFIAFIRYPLNFLVPNELRPISYFTCDSSYLIDAPTSCALPSEQNGLKCPIQCGTEILDQFGMKYEDSDLILYYFITLMYTIAFVVFSYLVVRNVNHVKR